MPETLWKLQLYEDPDGHKPFKSWLGNLTVPKKAAVLAMLKHALEQLGPQVAMENMGRHVGGGVFELYVEHTAESVAHRLAGRDPPVKGPSEEIWVRVFCHAFGDQKILLLGGYDKGREGERRQNAAIQEAQRCVEDFRRRCL